MERDPRSNREIPTVPLTPASTQALPGPRRTRRRQGLNPWYFVLIGGLPILILAIMLAAVAGGWPPSGLTVAPTATVVWDQLDRLTLDPNPPKVDPDPASGPGWYLATTQITNNSEHDLANVNVRIFFYDQAGHTIGSGLTDTGELNRGQQKPLMIQAQLINGSIPANRNTPTPAPLAGYARVEAKIIAVLPKATPTQ